MGVTPRQSKTGINIGTSGSWALGAATATAVGAGDGHYVRDDIGQQLKRPYGSDDSAGQNFIGSVQASNTDAIVAAIPMFLHFNDVWQNILWALALGTGGTSPTQIGASTAYTNTFEPATNKTGLYATIVRDKVQYIAETPGAKFRGFTLKVGENGRMEVDWKYTGDLEKSTSVINTSTQVSALTFPTLGRRVFFDQCVMRLNTQGGGALGSSDAMKFTELEVDFDQPLDTKHVGGSTTIVEPEEMEHPACTITLKFARFDATSDDFFAAHRDVTAYKMDITFTGPAIDATSFYGLLLQFPNVVVPDYGAPMPGGAGQVEPTMTLQALGTTAAPTGMSGVTKPIRVVTTGTATANPFA